MRETDAKSSKRAIFQLPNGVPSFVENRKIRKYDVSCAFFCSIAPSSVWLLSLVNISVCRHTGEMAVVVDGNRCRRSGNDRRRARADRNFDELRYGSSSTRSRLYHLLRRRITKETESFVLVAERSSEPYL